MEIKLIKRRGGRRQGELLIGGMIEQVKRGVRRIKGLARRLMREMQGLQSFRRLNQPTNNPISRTAKGARERGAPVELRLVAAATHRINCTRHRGQLQRSKP